MKAEKIDYYYQSLSLGKESPSEVARIQIELAAEAAYTAEALKTLRNQKPEFFLSNKTDEAGKKISNEKLEYMWQRETKGKEIALKTDLDILDKFLVAAKGCLIALSVESKIQE